MGRQTAEGEKSRKGNLINDSSILSRAEQEKFRLNLPAPSGKAKYS